MAAFAVAAGWLIYLASQQTEQSKVAYTRILIQRASGTVDIYRLERGHYPTSDGGFVEMVRDGYFREVPRDQWDNELKYRYPSERIGTVFEVWSLGSDGKP